MWDIMIKKGIYCIVLKFILTIDFYFGYISKRGIEADLPSAIKMIALTKPTVNSHQI